MRPPNRRHRPCAALTAPASAARRRTGEPNPTSWPTISSHFGVIDLAGFEKAGAAYYRAWWRGQQDVVYVFPHWTRPATDIGKPVAVNVYANASSCELLVNGASQGAKAMPPLGFLRWANVAYAPGNATVECRDAAGSLVGTGVTATAGPPARLEISVDAGANGVAGDGADVALVRVTVLDARGVLVPTVAGFAPAPAGAPPEVLVSFSVGGDGDVYGVANGDPADHGADKFTSSRRAFGGLVRLVARAHDLGGSAGAMNITARAPGLAPVHVVVPVLAAAGSAQRRP